MSAVFTITNNQSVFTATVVRSGDFTVTRSTSSFSANVISPGFTATLFRNILTVTNTDTVSVNITPAAITAFTGTIIDQTVGVDETVFAVTATNVVNTYTIGTTQQPISVTYNPTIVEHVYDGQPVYTTSSVQFRNLTLGNTSTFTFPANDGEYGYSLVTDGNGQLFWALAGGGGLNVWSLNDDLITNGFKIKSGSDAVDLEIQGGKGRIKLDSTGTYIAQTGTGELVFVDGGLTKLTNGERQLELSSTRSGIYHSTSVYFTLTNTTSTLKTDDLTLKGTDALLQYTSVKIESPVEITRNVTISQNHNLSAQDVTGTRQLISPRIYAERGYFNTLTTYDLPYIEVPPLKLSDGTILYGAQTITTSTLSLTGPLYTNDNFIKSNNAVGTIKLQQGDNNFTISNDITTSTGFTLKAGKDSEIHFFTSTNNRSILNIAVDELNFSGTTATFNQLVTFNGGLQFADGEDFDGQLADLRDVTITSPSSGQVLKYNGSYWYNGSDSGSTGTGVDTLIAGTGIAISTSSGDITITNIGVQTLSATNGLVVDRSTGSVTVTIGNLPIQEGSGGAIIVDTSTYGTTKISVDYNELFSHVDEGNGIDIVYDEINGRIRISQTATSVVLGGDLYTRGYRIYGANNELTIQAGETYIGTETRLSKIVMPVNDDMQLYSDYGIVIDTRDDNPVQVNSPFVVSHRSGLSRFSTEASGLMRLNDTIIAITATNRISLNNSTITPTSVKLQAEANNAYIEVQASTSTIAGNTVVIASTGTTKIGPDIYHSRLGVQQISNWNDTGPFTASKGVQFQDLSVQLTAYRGTLDFGALGTPATLPEQFMLQLLTVDFGNIASPSAYSYDAGTLG